MMRAEPRPDQVEGRVGERKSLDACPAGRDARQATPQRFLDEGGQHLVGDVDRDDLAGMRRDCERDVAAAATEIERPGRTACRRDRRDPFEILATGMDGAGDVVASAGAELLAHQTFV